MGDGESVFGRKCFLFRMSFERVGFGRVFFGWGGRVGGVLFWGLSGR